MGVVGRMPERAVDALLQLLGDDVLEPVGLGVDVVDRETERVGEVELEQPVVPDHLERDALARLGQAGPPVGLVLEQVEDGELLDHRRGRGRGDPLAAGEGRDGGAAARLLQLVDALQVVLDRPGERCVAHRDESTAVASVAEVRVRVGHSADPDDAFMFWAIEAGRVELRGLTFEPVVSDIETLNRWALEGRLEVSAVSLGAYSSIAERYALLSCGASLGIGYGPLVVARDDLDLERLRELEIVIPGRLTTAYLVLRLLLGDGVRVRELPFDLIGEEVASGRADAGLLIHEGQLTYERAGLRKVVDLGLWWEGQTGLPLPLGVNVARRDLGPALVEVAAVLGEAIEAGLAHREEALAYAERFGRGIDRATADRFVAMYVNEFTTDLGERGRRAVAELLARSGTGAGADFV